MLLDVNDAIQVHLLVETALGDSQEYEVLAPEEVDDLKKECQSLSQRIEQTQQNLALQSKYRDAANSMAKLYSSPDGKKKLRTDSVNEADMERMQSERKCEELAAELWSLEKRLMVPQNRLLKHTAGILQMTHNGPKNTPKDSAIQNGGVPGSPESMYTYHNARLSIEPISDEILFDERSFYRTADRLDGDSESVPRDSFAPPPPKSQAREQMQAILKMEQTMETLNKRLRDVIVAANPQRENSYSLPPPAKTMAPGRSTDPGEALQSHLDYMEKSIQAIDQEQGLTAKYQQESERAVEERVEELNREVRGLLLPYDPNHPEPPELTGDGLNQQLLYFQDSIGAIEMELSSAGKKGTVNDSGEMETMVTGLWEIIQSGEQDIRTRKQKRRATRAANGHPEDEDDSPDDDGDANEAFSLQGFSMKIQRLYSQATKLKDQKKVLQRQIKQQRDLNNKSDATKDAELLQKDEELQEAKSLLAQTEADANRVREELNRAMEELEPLRDQEPSGASEAELEEYKQTISDLEDQLQEMKDDHKISEAEIQSQISESEAKIADLTSQLTEAQGAATAAQIAAAAAQSTVAEKDQEVDSVKMELARLQTEVTIARAELDGAYGSRAERAAEVAAMAQQSSPAGTEQIQTLKRELAETITDYEAMTKSSIEWEKDRDRLEETIDKLRDERENLEAQLNEEKVRWLGMQSPGSETPGSTSTSTLVLKNEFKKMMRDTRAENAKALRVCLSFSLSLCLPCVGIWIDP